MIAENITPFNSPPPISKNSPINSDDLNSYFEGVSGDINKIASLINSSIVNMVNSMPPEYDPEINNFDGSNIYVNKDAKDKDNNLFWYEDPSDPGKSRPITIYEAFLLLMQYIANQHNGMREGIAIGNIASKVEFAGQETKEYSWVYSDSMFEYKLYCEENNSISKLTDLNIQVTVDTSGASKKLKIKNLSSSTKNIWGYIWHPVFNI